MDLERGKTMKYISQTSAVAAIMGLLTSTGYASANSITLVNNNTRAVTFDIHPVSQNGKCNLHTNPLHVLSRNPGLSAIVPLEQYAKPLEADAKQKPKGQTKTNKDGTPMVCVWASSALLTTGIGGWTPVTANDGCKITATDKGKMRGIKLTYTPECEVRGIKEKATR